MKDKLLIIGASGHGKVVADIAIKMGKWNELCFLDDDDSIKTSIGLDVIGKSSEAIQRSDEYDIFIGIGNCDIRKKIQTQLELARIELPVLVHPTAVIGEDVTISAGTVIMAGTVINCCTSIGKGCIINTGATIDHDNIIGDYVHISPGTHLAGTVTIGAKTWLGIGSIVSNNLNITNNCKFGAGAVIVKDINEPGTYVGVPVRRVE